MENQELQRQADEILKLAEQSGAQSNFFFVTTFQRYLVQLDILEDLAKTLDEEGMTVKKEYVKGRKNIYSNPALGSYNKTVDSANKTVATLMRILKNYGVDEKEEDVDPLMSIINGGDMDDRE